MDEGIKIEIKNTKIDKLVREEVKKYLDTHGITYYLKEYVTDLVSSWKRQHQYRDVADQIKEINSRVVGLNNSMIALKKKMEDKSDD